MLKLHGFNLSNYYNTVKLALLEKGLEFEEVQTMPGVSEKNPIGKVPVLETEQGFLSETLVILDYLEEIGSGPALFPSDPFAKAKVREMMKHMELYVELPARRVFPDAFFGGKTSDENKAEARKLLERGIASIKVLSSFSPYMAGDEMTYADISAPHTLGTASLAAKIVFGWNILEENPAIKELLEKLSQRETNKKVSADQKAAFEARQAQSS